MGLVGRAVSYRDYLFLFGATILMMLGDAAVGAVALSLMRLNSWLCRMWNLKVLKILRIRLWLTLVCVRLRG